MGGYIITEVANPFKKTLLYYVSEYICNDAQPLLGYFILIEARCSGIRLHLLKEISIRSYVI